MSTAALHRETFLPEGHTAQLAEVGEFLLRQTSVGQLDATAYALVSTDGQEQVAVPADLHRVLLQVVGTHRRLQLRDVLEYREHRRAAQYAALEATAVPPLAQPAT